MKKRFNVLVPVFTETEQRLKDGRAIHTVQMEVVGEANTMDEAKKLVEFPILEERK